MTPENKLFPKMLFFFAFVSAAAINNTTEAQVCTGSWASDKPLSYQCVSGQWIGSTNPSAEPVDCPVNPVYTAAQTNTFTFSSPVGGFAFDFTAFSTGPGCARMEIKINDVFYPLTPANLIELSFGTGCPPPSSFTTVTADGYITGSATSLMTSSGQGRVIIDGVSAASITISVNDGAGTVVTNPFNCTSTVPLKLIYFTGKAVSGCEATLSWETAQESNIRNIEIQRSLDGITFDKVTDILPKGSNSKYITEIKNYTDAYFRLKTNDLDGNYEYSKILKLKSNCGKITYQVSPNPAHSSIVLTGLEKNDMLFVCDMLGRKMLTFNSSQTNNVFDIQKLANGIYNLQVVNAGTIKANIKFIKQ